MNFEYEKDTWHIIKLYMEEQLTNHHINSFENFIEYDIPNIIKQFSPIIIPYDLVPELNKYKNEIHIIFEDHFIEEPIIYENNGSHETMTPSLARLRQLTYSSPLFINLKVKNIKRKGEKLEIEEIKEKELKKINFGKIPIMVKSKFCVLKKRENINLKKEGECIYDEGCYFLINGNEKIIVSQESISENKIFVFNNHRQNKFLSAEIKSINLEGVTIPVLNSVKYFYKTKLLYIETSNFKVPINIFIYFRLLGLKTDKELIEHVIWDIKKNDILMKELIPSRIEYERIINENNINTITDIENYLVEQFVLKSYNKDIKLSVKDKIKKMYDSIETQVLPHLENCYKKKILFFSIMIQKVLNVNMGLENYDDRDDYSNKIVNTPQYLLKNLYRQTYYKMIKSLQKTIKKDLKMNKTKKDYFDTITSINISKKIDSSQLETNLKKALAIGDFNNKSNYTISKDKLGISQALNRNSFSATLSHLRRINSPFDKNSGKIYTPRTLKSSHYGFICPSETPEGQAVGLVKNYANGSKVTSHINPYFLKNEWCFANGVKKIGSYNIKENYDNVKILINSEIIGIHYNPKEFVSIFKLHRTQNIINKYISIYWDHFKQYIYINTSHGRIIRPLYNVKNNILNIAKIKDLYKIKNFKNFMLENSKYNYIEFIDCNEVKNCLISTNSKELTIKKKQIIYKYSHCELHPSIILGILASLIPFPDHNQSPRNTYQSAMGKQAMGLNLTNHLDRMDTNIYTMNYIEAPICRTKYTDILNCNLFSNGQHFMLAILSYNGYNQEDSLIMNQGSIDRGLTNTTYYKTFKDEEKKDQLTGKEEKFCKPDKKYTSNIKPCNYDKIDENGFPKKNTFIDEKDIIIGKIIPDKNKNSNLKSFKCRSTNTKGEGHIEKVEENINENGRRMISIKKRTERIPTIGDKFSSRVGQKGTIGMILPEESMPYNKDGLKPDTIANPHCIPSRMTIGQLLESIFGKVSLILGGISDCTPFCEKNLDKFYHILELNGFDCHGYDILYDGITGKQIKCKVFMGPVFYQRLKHMVKDKIHSRGSGPSVQLTRQPPEGRSRDGGLRIGEMERDCMIAHGAISFLKESLLERSDLFSTIFCKKCGRMSVYNMEEDFYKCNICNNSYTFTKINIPYALKLLLHEIKGMYIDVKFALK